VPARLNPVLPRVAVGVLSLLLGGCSLFFGQSGPATNIEISSEIKSICLDNSAAAIIAPAQKSSDPKATCKNSQSVVKLIPIAETPSVLRLSLSSGELYFSRFQYCGKSSSPESMIRQLFVGADTVSLTSVQEEHLRDMNVTVSTAKLNYDKHNVAAKIFSLKSECFWDFVFWKTNATSLSSQEDQLISNLFETLWYSK
jgi:hypothetical protein